MTPDLDELAIYATLASYVVGGVLCAGAAFWIARFGDRTRPDRGANIAACFTATVWCALAAAFGSGHNFAQLSETARNIALIAIIFRLFAADGRDESLKPIRPVAIALILVQLFQPVLLLIRARAGFVPEVTSLTFEVSAILNMLVAIGALVLLHNLYAGAAAASRPLLRWSGIALAGIFAYDLNLYTMAYLLGERPLVLVGARGIFMGGCAALLAFGAGSAGRSLQFRPSRAVTFQTLSLLVISSYLLVMVLVTRSLTLMGGEYARASQIVFLVLGIILAAVWIPSKRVRGWLRVTATKHLFQHRYDYREEWLRFTRTVGRGTSGGPSFHERAIKAVADITDSPAGLLLVANDDSQLELTARWNWATLDVPAIAGERDLADVLEKHSYILDLGEVREGIEHHGELQHVPAWLAKAGDAWAMVPLIHFDRLIGAIVLARPRIERSLDWEDFDLLRVVGQQLASYLSEQAGQQALMDASRFDEFNRRMAFVMHDIKNLASQMSLLSSNAQKHADNPAFRADMLVTLKNSSDKLTTLLARLGRYGNGPVQEVKAIDLAALAKAIKRRFSSVHPVSIASSELVEVFGDPESLEQALVHLVQNAIDASEPDSPVVLSVVLRGLNGAIEIIDAGHGMSPDFVRTNLFKPFVSSKDGGFGIGAFEAREIIRAMEGRLSVESREGAGTRFTVLLPISHPQRVASNSNLTHQPSDEVA